MQPLDPADGGGGGGNAETAPALRRRVFYFHYDALAEVPRRNPYQPRRERGVFARVKPFLLRRGETRIATVYNTRLATPTDLCQFHADEYVATLQTCENHLRQSVLKTGSIDPVVRRFRELHRRLRLDFRRRYRERIRNQSKPASRKRKKRMPNSNGSAEDDEGVEEEASDDRRREEEEEEEEDRNEVNNNNHLEGDDWEREEEDASWFPNPNAAKDEEEIAALNEFKRNGFSNSWEYRLRLYNLSLMSERELRSRPRAVQDDEEAAGNEEAGGASATSSSPREEGGERHAMNGQDPSTGNEEVNQGEEESGETPETRRAATRRSALNTGNTQRQTKQQRKSRRGKGGYARRGGKRGGKRATEDRDEEEENEEEENENEPTIAMRPRDNPVFPEMYSHVLACATGSLAAAAAIASGHATVALNWHGGSSRARRAWASRGSYVNDTVLSVLELLNAGVPRAMVVSMERAHSPALEEAFYLTDRVPIVSFHRRAPRGSGREDDLGLGLAGTRGTVVNVPLPPGMGDHEYVPTFKAVVAAAITAFQPQCVVLLASPSCLSTSHGDFELTPAAHLECVRFLPHAWPELPLLVLGGSGGETEEAARVWAAETLVLCGVSPTDSVATDGVQQELLAEDAFMRRAWEEESSGVFGMGNLTPNDRLYLEDLLKRLVSRLLPPAVFMAVASSAAPSGAPSNAPTPLPPASSEGEAMTQEETTMRDSEISNGDVHEAGRQQQQEERHEGTESSVAGGESLPPPQDGGGALEQAR